MNKFKLVYFNGRGLAELTRLAFAYLGVPYEDVRIERENWDQVKPTTPWSQLPVLHVIDHKVVIGQSGAIARYVARLGGIGGSTPEESAAVESICDAVHDLMQQLAKARFYGTEEDKKKASEDNVNIHIPSWAARFEKHLPDESDLLFVGSKVTLADLAVYRVFSEILQTCDPKALSSFPKLQKHIEKVGSIPTIAAWVAKRPDTLL